MIEDKANNVKSAQAHKIYFGPRHPINWLHTQGFYSAILARFKIWVLKKTTMMWVLKVDKYVILENVL